MMMLLFKAALRGGAAADLFAAPVDVSGYTTKRGTFVAPHRATRNKHAHEIGHTRDLFAQPEPAKPKPAAAAQPSLFDAPAAPPPPATEPDPKPETSTAAPAAPPELFPKPLPTAAQHVPAPELLVMAKRARDLFARTNSSHDAAGVAAIDAMLADNAATLTREKLLAVVKEAEARWAARDNKPRTFGVRAGTSKKERKALNNAARAILAAKTDEQMTDADREALARYTGTGGVGDSLNEFYTPPEVASAMWDMLRAAGFQGGSVLEPSCGTGVFAHTAPADARLAMVEMEPTSARIARILHPAHEVTTSALEHVATQDGRLFDAVIGNPPYCPRGKLIAADKRDIGRAEQYFLDTALDKCRDGGLVAFVLPTSIMDASSTRAFRERILRKAEFLGGHRLPNTCFQAAHTEVTTDVLVFRKRPQEAAGALSAVSQEQLRALDIWDEDYLGGNYFTAGRGSENVLGRLGTRMGQWGEEMTVTGAMDGIPATMSAWKPDEPGIPTPSVATIAAAAGDDLALYRRIVSAALKQPYQQAKVGDTRVVDGSTYVLQGEPPRWHLAGGEVPEAVKDGQRVAEMLDDLHQGRASNPRATRAKLAEALDSYVEAHGLPFRNKELRAWIDAPSLPIDAEHSAGEHVRRVEETRQRTLRLLGAVNEDGTYSDLVTGHERTASAADLGTIATKLALERGSFTAEELAEATGKTATDIEDHLHGSADFAVMPDGKGWTTLDTYLTGELWPKLDETRAALAGASPALRPKLEAQAAALEKAIDPQSLEDVEIVLGSGFITPEDLTAWLAARTAARNERTGHNRDTYTVTFRDGLYRITTAEGKMASWGDEALIFQALNRKGVKKDDREAVERLGRELKAWVLSSDRRTEIEDRYNRTYRGFRPVKQSNSPIAIGGMNTEGLKDYQYGGVRWALAAGKGIIAADVGLGKTVRGLMLAKIAKETGQAKCPTFVVPKSVVSNWAAEAEKWFPGSRVLVIGETMTKGRDGTMRGKSDDAATRKAKYQQLQQNDYDFVFISAPAWNDLDITPELKDRYQDDDFWKMRGDAFEKLEGKKKAKVVTSWDQAQAKREFLERENTVYFDKLGIDMLIMDEGHAYKNLFAARDRQGESPKFLGGSGESKRALDTFHKTRALREANDGRGVFMLTATPTKNSPLEIYAMLSHIAPEAWTRMGIKNAEDFLDRFCTFEMRTILSVQGGFEDRLCTTGFKNLGELREVMRRYIDRTTAADVGLVLPTRSDHEHFVDLTPQQEEVYESLRAATENTSRDATGDAHIFSIMDKMGKATLDLSLIDPAHAGSATPKLDAVVENVAGRVPNGGQVVFCEAIDRHERLADMIAARGIPRNRIAIINGRVASTSAQRQAISDAFNAGKLDVVIANKTAEEGVNLQKRTSDIHHVDLPWEPATLQQRNGRGLRQGNTLEGVGIHTYLARASFDGYRWQTIKSKRDWQDLLWNGGDKVENLAMSGAGSAEEMMIALSKNPDETVKKLAENKQLAQAKKDAEARTKSIAMFDRYRRMKASLAELEKQPEKGGEVAARLSYRAGVLRDMLTADPAFHHKSLLDHPEPVFIEPNTGHAWTKGAAFELAAGDAGPIKWDDHAPSRWVVDTVGEGMDGKPEIRARLMGERSLTYVRAMEGERFKAGVTPIAYDAEEENRAIRAAAAAQDHEKADAVASLREIPSLSPEVVEARRDKLQAQLRAAAIAYKNHGDHSDPIPFLTPEGEAVIVASHNARAMAQKGHDFLLPTAANKEAAIAGYVRTALARNVKDRDAVQRGGRRGFGSSLNDGIQPHFPEHGSQYTGGTTNPWEAYVKRYYGDDALRDATAEVKKRAMANIESATSFHDAVAAASPTVNLSSYSGRVTPDMWPKDVVRALRKQAEKHGVLEHSMRDALGRLPYGARPVHHGLFKMEVPNGTTASSYGGTTQRTRSMSEGWSVDGILRHLAGDGVPDDGVQPLRREPPAPYMPRAA